MQPQTSSKPDRNQSFPNLKTQIVLLRCKIYVGINVTQFTKTLEEVSVLLLRKVFAPKNAGKSLCIPHKLKYDRVDIADYLS